ncbi:MAG: hypothetical protein ACOZBH_02770 [Patescibacteria group bacterium]
MMRVSKKILLISLMLSILTPLSSIAQTQISLAVTPLKHVFSIEPGQSQQGEIFLKNNSTVALKVVPRVVAFRTIDDQGTLEIIEGDFTDYVSLPVSVFELIPGERRQINFNVFAPANESGGRYFAILFAADTVDQTAGASFSGEVGSLVFMEILGDIWHQTEIKDVRSKKIYWSQPELSITLENKGNTHSAPFGEIKFFNLFGQKKETVTAFWPQILPGGERQLHISPRGNFFGYYKAQIGLVDSEWNYLTEEIDFWVLPKIYIFEILILLAAAIFTAAFIKKKSHA